MDVNVVSLPSSVPWAAIITATATLLALVVTLLFNYYSNAQRLDHERKMKMTEERLNAYATMARVTKTIEAKAPYENTDLAEAHAVIELVTDNKSIINIAGELLHAMDSARGVRWDLEQASTPDPFETPELKAAKERVERERAQFMRLAKGELGT